MRNLTMNGNQSNLMMYCSIKMWEIHEQKMREIGGLKMRGKLTFFVAIDDKWQEEEEEKWHFLHHKCCFSHRTISILKKV